MKSIFYRELSGNVHVDRSIEMTETALKSTLGDPLRLKIVAGLVCILLADILLLEDVVWLIAHATYRLQESMLKNGYEG